MVRKILEWSDKKFDEALLEENEKKGIAKAALSGAVEGFIDGVAIGGTIVAAYGWYTLIRDGIKLIKK